jgi:RNA polymerase sigma-70 factor, ECF subfamily
MPMTQATSSKPIEATVEPTLSDFPDEDDTLRTLVERIRGGECGALQELYALTAGMVFSVAHRMLRNAADTEEVVCDVYTQVWQTAALYDSARGKVMTWLMLICRSRAIDRCRRIRSRTCGDSIDAEAFVEPSSSIDNPDEWVNSLQEGTAIHRAIERLTPVRRHLLTLAFFEDLSHHEIAARTQIAEGTVKSHLRRAISTLRIELQGAWLREWLTVDGSSVVDVRDASSEPKAPPQR